MGADGLKSLYGVTDDVILYWAHHEKLCVVDGQLAFMGGLDLCFGRWDTNQHPIADAHPSDLNAIVFPGQDYNNARVMDFVDVAQWQENKLDRKKSSRMGWSDLSFSLQGPCVQDLKRHFVDRWNFIFDEKYNVRKDVRYHRLSLNVGPAGSQQSAQSGSRPSSSYGPGGQPQQEQQSQYQSTSTLQPSAAGTNQPQWQGGSRPHTPTGQYRASSSHQYSPQPAAQQSQPNYTPSDQGQYYPPPPPGGPPASQYGSQQPLASGYGGNPTIYQPLGTAELDSSGQQTRPHGGQPPTFDPPPSQATRGFDSYSENQPPHEGDRGFGGSYKRYGDEGRRLKEELSGVGNMLYGQARHEVKGAQGKYFGGKDQYGRPLDQPRGAMPCQIVRSCTTWSNGTPTEHSVQNAYCEIIKNSKHFIYIENQFFITATGDQQKPVQNLIGQALVERILRAARAGEKYLVIVNIPSIPAFAGDLRDDSSLGTRAIMEFQYNSINRGGQSIMELVGQAGYNPMEYIRFYNLRNYDRINAAASMRQAEQQSGVDYDAVRKQHENMVMGGPGSTANYAAPQQYQQYQQAAQGMANRSTRWDSVSECYMLNGTDIRNVPWDGTGDISEIDAFVSEELYIHTKVRGLGSANFLD